MTRAARQVPLSAHEDWQWRSTCQYRGAHCKALACGALVSSIRIEPWEDEEKNWQNAPHACVPLSPPPVHTFPPPPFLPKIPNYPHRPGLTSLAAWARWVLRSARPAQGGGAQTLVQLSLVFFRGPWPPLFFALFENQSIVLGVCARRWRVHTHSPFQECPRSRPNWLAGSVVAAKGGARERSANVPSRNAQQKH